jgi:hypothetical protein
VFWGNLGKPLVRPLIEIAMDAFASQGEWLRFHPAAAPSLFGEYSTT